MEEHRNGVRPAPGPKEAEDGPPLRLGPHDAAIWLMDPALFDPDAAWELLSPDEQGRALALRNNAVRREYLCTRALQRRALSAYAAVAPGDWRFASPAGGRPEIVAPASLSGLRFNLSHTEGLIACAVALDVSVGVDVESLASARNVDAMAHRFFAAEEARALAALPEARRPLRFLELWTLKEACLKALGTGFQASLDAVRVVIDEDGGVTGTLDPSLGRVGLAWQFVSKRLGPDHVLGLAIPRAHGGGFSVSWHRWPEGPSQAGKVLATRAG